MRRSSLSPAELTSSWGAMAGLLSQAGRLDLMDIHEQVSELGHH